MSAAIDEELKLCWACHEEWTRSRYSGGQWRARKQRRCIDCVSAGKPLCAPPPAAEPPAAAPAPVAAPTAETARPNEPHAVFDALPRTELPRALKTNVETLQAIYEGRGTLACELEATLDRRRRFIRVTSTFDGVCVGCTLGRENPRGEGFPQPAITTRGHTINIPGYTVSPKQQAQLELRVLHLAFESTCYKSVPLAAETDFDVVSRYLRHVYSSKPKKYAAEMIDLNQLLVHISRALRLPMCVALGRASDAWVEIALFKGFLAESLEAADRFEEAAPLYEERAHEILRFVERPFDPRLQGEPGSGFNNAAMAWKRAGHFAAAEALYLQGLRVHAAESPGRAELLRKVKLIYQNLLVCYETQLSMERERAIAEGTVASSATLRSLLTHAGWVSPIQGCGNPTTCLVPRILNAGPEGSTAELASLCSSATVDEFRSRMHTCIRPNKLLNIKLGDPGSARSMRKSARANARAVVGKANRMSGVSMEERSVECAACGTMRVKQSLMQCPCKLVLYCDRACGSTDSRSLRRGVADARLCMCVFTGDCQKCVGALVRCWEGG